MKELAQIASAVQVSSTMAMDMLAKQMKADGVDVVGFGAGEPPAISRRRRSRPFPAM